MAWRPAPRFYLFIAPAAAAGNAVTIMQNATFTLAIPIFERQIPYRLSINDTGKLISINCLLDDLEPAAVKLIIGDQEWSFSERRQLMESLLPLAIPLWSLLDLAPTWAAEIARWGRERTITPPNVINSSHPEHLLRDYAYEYYYLGHMINKVFATIALHQPEVLPALEYSWRARSNPFFDALNRLTIPFIADVFERVNAFVMLLKQHTDEKELWVMGQVNKLWQKDHLPRHHLMSLYLHLKSEVHRSELLRRISQRKFMFNQFGFQKYSWGEEKLWPEMHYRHSIDIGPNDGGILSLLKGNISATELIDRVEKNENLPQYLAKWFGIFQRFRKDDDRIPSPEVYLQYIIDQPLITEPWHEECWYWGEVVRKYHHTVNFGEMLSDLLESNDALRVIHACFIYGTTYIKPVVHQTRMEDGRITASTIFTSKPLIIRDSAISALLYFHLAPEVWAHRYLGDSVAFNTLEFLALQQPEALPLVVDALLEYENEQDEERCMLFLAILVNLSGQNYRSGDIFEKVSGYIKGGARLCTTLMKALAKTHLPAYEKLLPARSLLSPHNLLVHNLEDIVMVRLQGFTDNYHCVPPSCV